MKKVEALKQLREVVLNQPESLAHGEYYSNANGQCCVVGHLLKANGASVDQLIALDKDLYNADDYTIAAIMESSREGNVNKEEDFVAKIFSELGFDMEDDEELLVKLQQINDNSNGNQEKIVAALDEEIAKLEAK